MRIATRVGVALAVRWGGLLSIQTGAQQPAGDAPRYTGGELELPRDYRAWPFIGAGLGMSYADGEGTPEEADNPLFTHAFVNPSSYAAFMQTGAWPDGTTFILEFRRSAGEGSINVAGRFATGLAFLEAEVKDSRFPDGWAYFNFGPGDDLRASTAPLDAEASAACVECHTEHGAVERTFVQFYPTLLKVARERGTLKPGF
jgi:hypothetical protein